MLNLKQVRNSSVANIAGVNVNDPQFAVYVNDAVRILVDMGEWWGTVKAMVGTTYRGCMIWPSNVSAVYAINAGRRQIPVSNYWYEFVEFDGHSKREFENVIRPLVGGGRPNSVVRFSGTVPVFNPPTAASPFAIQVTAGSVADYGQTVTIYGQDTNGLEVATVRNDGSTQRGYLLTLAAGATFTTTVFSNITTVVKDITTAPVSLWVYSPSAPFGTAVAIYQGWETSPQYLFSDLRGYGDGSCCNEDKPHCIEALVSLSATDVAQDSDLIIIDNIEAIKLMVQSLKAREGDNSDEADKLELTAVRRMNAELRKRFPFQQTPINLRAMGTAHPRRHSIGQIM